jgi:hypothetical protein
MLADEAEVLEMERRGKNNGYTEYERGTECVRLAGTHSNGGCCDQTSTLPDSM